MKKEYATLARKPFLTPIWLAALAAFVVASFTIWLWGTATSTTVVLVRHAEKQLDAGNDPPLTPAGEARAALLARMIGAGAGYGHLDAIYVSPTRRSRQTAAPLAQQSGIPVTVGPENDPKALAHLVLREHQGQHVLIVAHSNTIPAIVQALSGAGPVAPVRDDEYGTMYVVTVPRIGRSSVLRLSY
jgi:2,3-bisphosphoglycerate-dependent phosphoglycerate mutase